MSPMFCMITFRNVLHETLPDLQGKEHLRLEESEPVPSRHCVKERPKTLFIFPFFFYLFFHFLISFHKQASSMGHRHIHKRTVDIQKDYLVHLVQTITTTSKLLQTGLLHGVGLTTKPRNQRYITIYTPVHPLQHVIKQPLYVTRLNF